MTRKEEIAIQIGELLRRHREDKNGNDFYDALSEMFPDGSSRERALFIDIVRDYFKSQNDVELRVALSIFGKFKLFELISELKDLRNSVSHRDNWPAKLGLLIEIDNLLSK
jgi:hypothetical protein